MKEKILNDLSASKEDLETVEKILNIPSKRRELDNLTEKTSAESFDWTDYNTLKTKAGLERLISSFDESMSDIEFYCEWIKDCSDEELGEEIPNINKAFGVVHNIKIQSIFSQPEDEMDAFLEITSGAGGVDSQDCAEMIERMYLRFGEKNPDFKVELVDRSKGLEAGIKSSILKFSGMWAYGYLKYETGVHRIVRLSPFNSNAKRQTSFVNVSVTPVIDDTIEINIEPKDLRIDFFRSSGAGGQHVNTTDSAVRITHIPSGIVCTCQDQRSQFQNKASAMQVLRSKLYALEVQKKRDASNAVEKVDIGWGSQIRNYVLHPYKMVKDLRTLHETSAINDVLEGDIQLFLTSCIEKLTNNKSF